MGIGEIFVWIVIAAVAGYCIYDIAGRLKKGSCSGCSASGCAGCTGSCSARGRKTVRTVSRSGRPVPVPRKKHDV